MPPLLPETSRRRLLGRATQTAAAAAAVTLAGPAGALADPLPPAPASPESAPSKGYRDSERNRRYYRLARY